jgi:hypothetical protein
MAIVCRNQLPPAHTLVWGVDAKLESVELGTRYLLLVSLGWVAQV